MNRPTAAVLALIALVCGAPCAAQQSKIVEVGDRSVEGVENWRTSDTGRESKFFRLRPKWRRQLKSDAASWARLTEVIGLILKPAGGSR
jgi:hypothetical protein